MFSGRSLRGSQSAVSQLRYDAPVLLVGAGPTSRQQFDTVSAFTEAVVAVDGGYDALTAWGVAPDAVLGDMDSVGADIPDSVREMPISEQNSTDLEKALLIVDAPAVLGIGFLGARLDHTFAAMHAILGTEKQVILVGDEDLVFAAPTEWRGEFEPGTRISFFPARRVAAIGSKGLRWPIDGLLMEAGGQIGVSNEVVSSRIAVWFAERGAITILPRHCLDRVVASFA